MMRKSRLTCVLLAALVRVTRANWREAYVMAMSQYWDASSPTVQCFAVFFFTIYILMEINKNHCCSRVSSAC